MAKSMPWEICVDTQWIATSVRVEAMDTVFCWRWYDAAEEQSMVINTEWA
jgi:hypothetical protein